MPDKLEFSPARKRVSKLSRVGLYGAFDDCCEYVDCLIVQAISWPSSAPTPSEVRSATECEPGSYLDYPLGGNITTLVPFIRYPTRHDPACGIPVRFQSSFRILPSPGHGSLSPSDEAPSRKISRIREMTSTYVFPRGPRSDDVFPAFYRSSAEMKTIPFWYKDTSLEQLQEGLISS